MDQFVPFIPHGYPFWESMSVFLGTRGVYGGGRYWGECLDLKTLASCVRVYIGCRDGLLIRGSTGPSTLMDVILSRTNRSRKVLLRVVSRHTDIRGTLQFPSKTFSVQLPRSCLTDSTIVHVSTSG